MEPTDEELDQIVFEETELMLRYLQQMHGPEAHIMLVVDVAQDNSIEDGAALEIYFNRGEPEDAQRLVAKLGVVDWSDCDIEYSNNSGVLH